MKRVFFQIIVLCLFILCALRMPTSTPQAAGRIPWWSIQSIDTMKYSRDKAREMLNDPSFDEVIDLHVKRIAETGATHVSIATPYDEEFGPVLVRWIRAARKYGLHIWFRGNFSGWEGWFEYGSINRKDHIVLLGKFIESHPEYFRSGDLFSACPECENGGPGDPRKTGDVRGFQQFLIDEYQACTSAFARLRVSVNCSYASMNADIARLVMDKETTARIGGVVTIDHYVKNPQTLADDIRSIAKRSGGRIMLGEFGAPIPDIHGSMTENEQESWIRNAMESLYEMPELIGINYWVSVGGSTELWTDGGTKKPVVDALYDAFVPSVIVGSVVDEFGGPLSGAKVSLGSKTSETTAIGQFSLPIRQSTGEITVEKAYYVSVKREVSARSNLPPIVLSPSVPSVTHRFAVWLFQTCGWRLWWV
jgi:hypothetical protein